MQLVKNGVLLDQRYLTSYEDSKNSRDRHDFQYPGTLSNTAAFRLRESGRDYLTLSKPMDEGGNSWRISVARLEPGESVTLRLLDAADRLPDNLSLFLFPAPLKPSPDSALLS